MRRAPFQKSLNNYWNIAKKCISIIFIRKTLKKNKIRFIAENSLRLTMSYLMTICSIHFLPCERVTLAPPSDVKNATKGAMYLFNHLKKLQPNFCLIPVHPALLFSTDDTGLFTCERGKKRKNTHGI